MKDLFKGVKKFCSSEYSKNKKLFKGLEQSQSPHTLFICCSDSRVLPDLITKSLPGELFVVRNIANLIPYWRRSDEYLATTSAIEYAVLILKVENIVVCGHSDCGGCRALMNPEAAKEAVHVPKWMELAAKAKEKVLSNSGGHCESGLLEKENVLQQIEHLMTYPFVRDRRASGKLNVYGWYYDIGEGRVYNYDWNKKEFTSI